MAEGIRTLRVTIFSIGLALLALPTTGLQAQTDEQAELLARVEAVYDTSGHRAVPDDPQAVLREAHRRFETLRPEIQDGLRTYLEPPGGRNEDGSPRAPGADSGERVVEGEHAVVYYLDRGPNAVPAADGDRNGVPDYVDLVVAGVDRAWQRYESWGFRKPPMQALTVHFKSLNCNAICHPGPAKETWLEINSNIVAFNKGRLGASYRDDFTGDPEGPEAGLLRVTTAHELFHSFQMMYDWSEADWWCEGTADWAGRAVNTGSKFYVRNLGSRFRSPERSLFSNDGMNEYAASLFALFLQENYGGGDDGARLIRKIWEGCENATAEEAAQSVLTGIGTSLEEAFTLFSCYNYLKEYGDALLLPDMKVQSFETLPAKVKGLQMERFGSAVFECRASEDQGTLRFECIFAKQGFQARLVTVDQEKTWRILPLSPQPNGHFVAEVPGYGSRNVKAAVIVTWTGNQELSPSYAIKAETH